MALAWMVVFGALCLWVMSLLHESVLKNVREEQHSSTLRSSVVDSVQMRSSFSKKLIERKLNLGKASTLERPPALAKALVSSSVAKTSDKPADKNNYHLVFSTSCSKKDWQSYLFFYLAMAHEQSGDVTHVVSGCQDQETEDEIRQMHEEQHTKAMSENFHIHFTPEYSNKKDFQTTKYWNKPFGVRHWLEHRFGFEYDKSKADVAKPTEYDDDVRAPLFMLAELGHILLDTHASDVLRHSFAFAIFRLSF